ncbi:MAPEG family protein [Aestuariibius insulae]|uniref:MAPEG family protein n=1 Tax=Aestuariibius insulae TaxID=2058287 RepID=UPI00345EC573
MTLSTILALYGLLVAITLVLQATGYMQKLGMGYLLSSRDEHRTVEGMAARLDRALNNSVVGMALFGPAVLLLIILDRETNQALLAAQVFLAARVVYLPAYVFGIVGLRTFAWSAGFVATVILYLLAL